MNNNSHEHIHHRTASHAPSLPLIDTIQISSNLSQIPTRVVYSKDSQMPIQNSYISKGHSASNIPSQNTYNPNESLGAGKNNKILTAKIYSTNQSANTPKDSQIPIHGSERKKRGGWKSRDLKSKNDIMEQIKALPQGSELSSEGNGKSMDIVISDGVKRLSTGYDHPRHKYNGSDNGESKMRSLSKAAFNDDRNYEKKLRNEKDQDIGLGLLHATRIKSNKLSEINPVLIQAIESDSENQSAAPAAEDPNNIMKKTNTAEKSDRIELVNYSVDNYHNTQAKNQMTGQIRPSGPVLDEKYDINLGVKPKVIPLMPHTPITERDYQGSSMVSNSTSVNLILEELGSIVVRSS